MQLESTSLNTNVPSKSFWIFIAVIVLTVFIYLPALDGDFYHDDRPNILENASIQLDSLNKDSLIDAAFSSSAGKLKRPVSMTSFALNYYFFGTEPYSFKVVNLIIHILVGCALFILIYFLKQIASPDQSKNKSIIFALIVSSIWLLHPLHVSTVAYIVQRMAMLSALFSILGLLLYIIARNRLAEQKPIGWLLLAASFSSIIIAIFCKENGILAFLLILITEVVLYNFKPAHNKSIQALKYFFIAGFVFSILGIIYYLPTIIEFINRGYTDREFSIKERLYTQFRALTIYIKWLFIPNIKELGLFHDDIPISKSLFQPLSTFLSLAVIIFSVVFSCLIRKQNPIILFGVLWYLCCHLLESTILPLEMFYEHRNYLPSIGILLILTELVFIALRFFQKNSIPLLLLVVPFILAFTTNLRANQWTDVVNFSYYEALHHPNSPRAVYALGRVYANLAIAGQLQFKSEAYRNLEQASKLESKGILPETVMILLASKLGDQAEIRWFSSIIEKLKYNKLTVSDIDSLSALTKCANDQCVLSTEEATIIFTTVFENPTTKVKNGRRADLLSIYANFQTNRVGNFLLAEKLMQEAIDISPNTPQYRVNYINLLLVLQRPQDASFEIDQLRNIKSFGTNNKLIEELEHELSLLNLHIENAQNDN